MAIKRIEAYQTSDGSTFSKLPEAEMHEGAMLVRKWVADQGIGHGGEWSGEMVANSILEGAQELLEALGLFLGAEIK